MGKCIYDSNDANSKLYQRWNKTTIECFNRNLICSGCPNDAICSLNKVNHNKYKIRQVKYSTIMTYRNLGKPPDEQPWLLKGQEKVIYAILTGCNDKYEISKYSGIGVESVQTYLCDLYEIMQKAGFVFKNKGYKLPEFIRWLRDYKEKVEVEK